MEEYQDAVDSYMGWCTTCEQFTTGCVEPDAEGYRCEKCDEHTVMGAEQALICMEIEIA